jgi:hypothetical protein
MSVRRCGFLFVNLHKIVGLFLYRIPIYIVPFKVVIKPKVADYLADAEDIMAMADGKGGLFCFEGESHTAIVSRLCSHREWLEEQKNKPKRKIKLL